MFFQHIGTAAFISTLRQVIEDCNTKAYQLLETLLRTKKLTEIIYQLLIDFLKKATILFFDVMP